MAAIAVVVAIESRKDDSLSLSAPPSPWPRCTFFVDSRVQHETDLSGIYGTWYLLVRTPYENMPQRGC